MLNVAYAQSGGALGSSPGPEPGSLLPAYLQDPIVLALHTGLCCGDIFNLQWKEVDFDRRRLK